MSVLAALRALRSLIAPASTDAQNKQPKNLQKGCCTNRGCKPEPQKFPSPKIKPRHERIEVDHLAVALEGVMPVQQDVPPGRWRYLGDECECLGIAARLVLRQQPRQDCRVVEDDRACNQPKNLS